MDSGENSNKKLMSFDIANSSTKINKAVLFNGNRVEKHLAW